MAFYSPLRYPGGKGKIASFFYAIFEQNSLCDGTYVEPYAGGASVALSLLYNEYVSNVIINDIDRSIYAFWHSVLFNNEKLCNLIHKTKVNLKTWEESRVIQKRKARAKLLDLGFSTFFLNRTNRSGIINGGMIGGRAQNGKWRIDARYNKVDLINRIRRAGQYRNRIKIYNFDAYKLLQNIFPSLSKKTLCYFDPPYYEKGKALYVNYYRNSDHTKIAKKIQSIKKVKWIVSYDDKKEVKNMYRGSRCFEYTLNYSASNVSLGKEVMFFSKDLNVSKDMLSALQKD